jgi:hypothetical protein
VVGDAESVVVSSDDPHAVAIRTNAIAHVIVPRVMRQE